MAKPAPLEDDAMTDAFWWYLLAGFIIGFTLSTLWEWLYFRRKRMRIENRRIAELEAMLRSYSIAQESQSVAAGSGESWVSPSFNDPGAYLDIEDEAAVAAAPPADLPAAMYSFVGTAPINGERSMAAAPPALPPRGVPEASSQRAAMAAAGSLAASREEPTAPVHRFLSPLQPSATPRSSLFPTAAAQVTSTPSTAEHRLSAAATSSDGAADPAKAAFPSAAAHPVTTRVPFAVAPVPSSAGDQPAPTGVRVEPVPWTAEIERAVPASAGNVAAVAAAERPAAETRQAPVLDAAAVRPAAEERHTAVPIAGLGTVAAVAAAERPAAEVGQAETTDAARRETRDGFVGDSLRVDQAAAAPAPSGMGSCAEPTSLHPGTIAAMTIAAIAADELSEQGRVERVEPVRADRSPHGAAADTVSTSPAVHGMADDGTDTAATRLDGEQSESITPAKLDALVASIHELIDAVHPARTESIVAAAASGQSPEKGSASPADLRFPATEPALSTEQGQDWAPTNRVEEALILLVRSVSRFLHQLRAIMSRESAQTPPLRLRAAGADLMRIDGPRYAALGIGRFPRLGRDEAHALAGADLATLLASWGGPTADLNGDGNTDGADLAVFLGAWGACP